MHTEHEGPGMTISFWKHLLLIKKMTLSELRGLVYRAYVWKTVCNARVSLRGMWDTRQEKHTSKTETSVLPHQPGGSWNLQLGCHKTLILPYPRGLAYLRVKHCLYE